VTFQRTRPQENYENTPIYIGVEDSILHCVPNRTIESFKNIEARTSPQN